jgi:putative acetyltransferase
VIVRDGGLDHPATAQLLSAHLADMHASSPPDSVYALDLSALATPDIAFFTAWEDDTLLGCGALRNLGPNDVGKVESLPSLEVRGRGWVGQLADETVPHHPTHPQPLPVREGSASAAPPASRSAPTNREGEIKSMRTDPAARGRGVAQAILDRIVTTARAAGMTRLVLETGTGPMFDAAHRLYARNGFVPCPAFGDYVATDFNRFLCRPL